MDVNGLDFISVALGFGKAKAFAADRNNSCSRVGEKGRI